MQVIWSGLSTRKLVYPSALLTKMPPESLNLFSSLMLLTIGTHSLNKSTSLMNLTPSWPISWYIWPFLGPIFCSFGSKSPRSGSLILWNGFDTFLMLLTSNKSDSARVTPSTKGQSSAVVLNKSYKKKLCKKYCCESVNLSYLFYWSLVDDLIYSYLKVQSIATSL